MMAVVPSSIRVTASVMISVRIGGGAGDRLSARLGVGASVMTAKRPVYGDRSETAPGRGAIGPRLAVER